MPKLTIDLPADTNEKLKLKAKADYRSLTNYITVALINLANDDNSVQPQPYSSSHSSPTLTLDQLQQQGIADIKFTKQRQERVLSDTEQELQQNKLLLQQNKMKQQRLKFLETKALEILGYIPPYIERNDQKVIDRVLNDYPTEEDIITFLKRLKNEDDLYGEEDNDDEYTNEPDNEDYKKIKEYFIGNQAIQDYEFDDLVDHAKVNDIQYIKDFYKYYIFNALRISQDVELDDEQWTELLKCLY